ncbi:MAG TPA: peroxiredoxin, partial [Abditibacteriaceae bacterium]
MNRAGIATLAAVAAVSSLWTLNAVSQDRAAVPATAPLAVSDKIDVGSVAPDFALPDQDNKLHRLSDLKGKTAILVFYPVDMTAGCSLQARNLTESLNVFEKRGVKVFGISVQDVASKRQFCDKEGIKYPLLADIDKSVARNYGVLSGGVAQRVSFIVGADGKVAAV